MIIENSGPGEKGRPVRIRTAVRRQGQVKQKKSSRCMQRRAAKTLTRKEWRVLARSTPPQKPVYPKNEPQPRRQAPQRPVYTYDADVPRQPRKPAGGRVVYDYNKSAGASSGVPAGSPARPAAPFVNTAPQAPQQGRGTAPAAGNNAGIPEPRQPRDGGSQARGREEIYGRPPRSQAQAEAQRRPQQDVRRTPQREEPRWRALPEQEAELKPRPGVYDQSTDRPRQPRANSASPGPARTPGGPPPGKSGKARKKRRKKRPPRPLTPGEARRRRVRRGILAGVLIAVLLAAGFLISAAVLFKIETVTVESPDGQLAYDDSQIVAAFGQPAGENLFGFNTAEAQQAIAAALPYLESVEIKRRLPDTVVITATPAVETYTVESAAGWAVLSQSYKVLRVDAEAPAGLVRIDGAQADAPAPGQPVKFTEEDKLSVLQTVLSKAQAQGLGPISEVDLTNTLELSFLYQDRIRIVLGTTNDLDYKIKWAWEMVTPGQTSDSLGEEERGTLDVSSRGEDGLGRARWRAGVL